jgi:tetratricopeptide (TPR) repeat protein
MRYNPGFLTEDQLVESFVVRREHLSLLIDAVRGNDGSSNQHVLIIGARGSGKTTLVRRLAAEIHRAPDLAEKWYPIVFGEESYEIFTAGEFWLAALFHLAGQTGDANLALTHKELLAEKDERRLRDRALAQLLDFADREKRRLALVVENLNMLLGEQMVEGADWDIRHTLMNESRLMLVGTATSMFDAIENDSQAWFGLFTIHELRPLNLEECGILWKSIVGENDVAAGYPMRPVEILTGGNPRLLGILAGFSQKRSFRNLLENLTELIDEHTDYFKSRLEYLPATERKVFATVLDIWDPTTAREVADESRMDINKASSMLKRLVERGAVMVVDTEGGRKYYQASERLFNVYHLMRRRGETSGRVFAAVRFIFGFYPEEEIEKILNTAIQECPEMLGEIIDALRLMLEITERQEQFAKEEEERYHQIGKHHSLGLNFLKTGQFEKAEFFFKKAMEFDPEKSSYSEVIGITLLEQKKYTEAIEVFENKITSSTNNEEAEQLLLHAILGFLRSTDDVSPALQAFHKSLNETDLGAIHWFCVNYLVMKTKPQKPEFWLSLISNYGETLIKNSTERLGLSATTLFFTYAAADGCSEEALKLILDTDKQKKFETLEVGLRIYLGESPRRAHEILEVGKDVAKRIQELTEKRAAMIAESASQS